jgi:hypothetical protein
MLSNGTNSIVYSGLVVSIRQGSGCTGSTDTGGSEILVRQLETVTQETREVLFIVRNYEIKISDICICQGLEDVTRLVFNSVSQRLELTTKILDPGSYSTESSESQSFLPLLCDPLLCFCWPPLCPICV